ncbi:DUF4349 domain-containing protein [Paenibacillus sp. LHD-38]|uniref:DUF4349 domain-containing protein n=1 Tax=Paenibacillus sp. LHD-38 TaxID=3072143 RepID=UPI00280D824A|nr:DUF4349 domain-containing protein [Paenibacillus sp. LHD-38]MDQ8736848.1 DUF4349 domain-containing protein [Paenibacillus sp. LHD-38]
MLRHKYGLGKGVFILLLLISLLAGCSASNGNSATSDGKMAIESESAAAGNVSSEMNNSEAAAADSDSAAPVEGSGTTATAGGGFASETAADGNGINQKIIYTATLSMQVDELEAAGTSLRNAIHQSGAYILQFQDTKHEGEIGASYTIKVPASGFMSFIDRIEEIKHNDFERNIGGKDVSEEYVDLESRLKARQLVETRLLSMMDKAVKADDLLKFSQQLSEVQEEIERIKGRIRYLDNNVAFSTVELRMYQTNQTLENKSNEYPKLGGRMSDALVSSTKVVWDAINFLLVVLAGAVPVLVLLAIIGVPVLWFYRKGKRKDNKKANADDKEDDRQEPIL